MKSLTNLPWLSDDQLEVLTEHKILTLEELASFEIRDSLADAPPLSNLRQLATQARRWLRWPDPLENIDGRIGQ